MLYQLKNGNKIHLNNICYINNGTIRFVCGGQMRVNENEEQEIYEAFKFASLEDFLGEL